MLLISITLLSFLWHIPLFLSSHLFCFFFFYGFSNKSGLSLPALSIELQVQEQPHEVRSDIYSHMEAFVPCNKEALLKRMKKLSLNIQVSGSCTVGEVVNPHTLQ